MSRDLLKIALALTTWGVGEGMFFFFEPLYLQQLGASPLLIGGILGAIGAAMTVAHLPAGYLADRIGSRPLLVTAWMMGTAATALMALAPSLPVFIVGQIIYGLTAFVSVPLSSYVTTARGKMTVGRALTLTSAAFNLGAILGPLLGGWIGEHAGLRSSFFIATFIFVASTIVIFLIRPQPVEKHANSPIRQSLAGLLSPRYSRYLFVVFIAMFFLYLPQPLSQNFLQNERGVNLAGIGQLISARSLGVVLLNLGLGQLNARIGFLLAQVGVGLFTVLIWRGDALPWYLAGYLLMGGYQTARSLATAQGRTLLVAANMGLGYGLIETVNSAAAVLAPPLAGLLYARNPVWIYPASLGMIGMALVITSIFSPLKRKDVT